MCLVLSRRKNIKIELTLQVAITVSSKPKYIFSGTLKLVKKSFVKYPLLCLKYMRWIFVTWIYMPDPLIYRFSSYLSIKGTGTHKQMPFGLLDSRLKFYQKVHLMMTVIFHWSEMALNNSLSVIKYIFLPNLGLVFE